MKLLYIITVAACLFAACSKDKLEEYGQTNYIYLANDSATVIEYSFAFHPGEEKDTVPVAIKLVGRLSGQDRPVALLVDASHTTALNTDFQLPNPILLRGGRATDTINLILHKSARLQQQKFKLRLMLSENDIFHLGPVTNRFIDIVFSDMIARPAWWNNVVTTNFLGQYSDTKYRLFIEATGIADMAGLSENEQRAYAIIFRDFLARGREQGETYVDENGNVNVSPNLN